ncbi:MAG: CRISPR-associated protein Cas4 [Clostridiales bacterium]|nr:CRISPR-associated protein Cas4 [Clostridiales bacterium]
MAFDEGDYLQLSGIQHFVFCRRQWALIHLEQQWAENLRTAEGRLLHKNAHDNQQRTLRGDLLTVRAMRVHSARLGLSGECDVVEFRRSAEGVPLTGEKGLWLPYPVEYKRGRAKPTACDEAQLCAQAMCLEEMLCCTVPEGALFYGQPRRRQEVVFTPELRATVERAAGEMHQLFQRGYTPKSKPSKGCNACSLKNLCLPGLSKTPSVADYLRGELNEP